MEEYNGTSQGPDESDGAGALPNDNIYVDGLPSQIDNGMLQEIFGVYGDIKSIKAMPGKRPGQKGAALMRWASTTEADWVVNNLNGKPVVGLDEPVVIRFAQPRGRQQGKGETGAAGAGKGGYGKADGKSYSGYSDYGGLSGAYDAGAYGAYGAYDAYDAGAYGAGRNAPYQGGGAQVGKGSHRSAGKGVSDADINDVVAGFFSSGQMPGGFKAPELCLYVSGLPRNTSELDMFKIFSVFGALAQKGINVMKHPDGSCTGVGFVDYQDQAACQVAVVTLNGSTLPDGTPLSVRLKSPKRQ